MTMMTIITMSNDNNDKHGRDDARNNGMIITW